MSQILNRPLSVELSEPNTIRRPLTPVNTNVKPLTPLAKHDINPLTQAASGIFQLIGRLRHNKNYSSLDQLQANLIQEVQAFECTAQQHGCSADHTLLARFIICCYIDDSLAHTSWAKDTWLNKSILATFHGQQNGDEQFFFVLRRLLDVPGRYVELLQLAYLCINLGFEGKYRYRAQGHKKLMAIMEDVYQAIQTHHAADSALISYHSTTHRRHSYRFKPLATILSAVLALTCCTAFIIMSDISFQPLYQQINLAAQ